MQIRLFKLFLLGATFVFLLGETAWAQEGADLSYSDYHPVFQLRPGLKINKDFKQGWNLNAGYTLRADITNRNIEGHYFSLGLKYKAFKFLQPDFNFRYANTLQDNSYRFEFGLKARYPYKKWVFAFRTAYFYETEYFATRFERGHFPTNCWRNRLEVNYKFKKQWSAYLTAELYTRFTYRGVMMSRAAFVAGLEYDFKKMHSLTLFYRAQPQFKAKFPDLLNAVGVVYTWDIPNSFKKKKKKSK